MRQRDGALDRPDPLTALRRLASAAAILLLGAVAVVSASSAAPVSAAAADSGPRPCSAYPHPGSVARGRTPAALTSEYGVLRRAPVPSDRLRAGQLGRSLSAAGVLVSQARRLGTTPTGARIYLVPAQHLLEFPLAPDRCLSVIDRGLERGLHAALVREYAHRALCLLVVRPAATTSACRAAPGTVDPILSADGAAAFGLVPNGVAAVVLRDRSGSARRSAVHDNFWMQALTSSSRPCGLDWTTGSGTVLRTILSCTAETS